MLKSLIAGLKGWVARILAKMFYRVVDPRIESELAIPHEYIRIQNQRRREIEQHLARYLGPRL